MKKKRRKKLSKQNWLIVKHTVSGQSPFSVGDLKADPYTKHGCSTSEKVNSTLTRIKNFTKTWLCLSCIFL